jgi:hypothetical protein
MPSSVPELHHTTLNIPTGFLCHNTGGTALEKPRPWLVCRLLDFLAVLSVLPWQLVLLQIEPSFSERDILA